MESRVILWLCKSNVGIRANVTTLWNYRRRGRDRRCFASGWFAWTSRHGGSYQAGRVGVVAYLLTWKENRLEQSLLWWGYSRCPNVAVEHGGAKAGNVGRDRRRDLPDVARWSWYDHGRRISGFEILRMDEAAGLKLSSAGRFTSSLVVGIGRPQTAWQCSERVYDDWH